MDHTKTINTSITAQLSHPAYLFIGDPEIGADHTITLLQQQFCAQSYPDSSHKIKAPALPFDSAQDKLRFSNLSGVALAKTEGGCGVCTQCRKIREQQHESVVWLCPEKQYAIDDLDVIFSTLSFALEPHQNFFFVLQKADLLTTTCANALLKSLEEPPAGYHFILLAQRAELLLPTIKSRCIIEQHQTRSQEAPITALLSFFSTTTFHDPIAFSKELESINPSEWESLALLDQLIIYWANIYKKNVISNNQAKIKQAERMLQHLKKAMLQPPMPGSSKLFWKNLFLQIKEL